MLKSKRPRFVWRLLNKMNRLYFLTQKMEITPKELEGIKLYRLTYEDEKHNGFQYQDELNVDTLPFNPVGECELGGLYFFCDESLHTFPNYVNMNTTKWIREVTLLPDSRIYKMENKFKTDKFFLGTRSCLSDFLDKMDMHWNMLKSKHPRFVWQLFSKKDGHCNMLKSKRPICLAAAQQNEYALGPLQYVNEQTPEICLAAVQQDGRPLQYVEEQTPKICLAAVAA